MIKYKGDRSIPLDKQGMVTIVISRKIEIDIFSHILIYSNTKIQYKGISEYYNSSKITRKRTIGI